MAVTSDRSTDPFLALRAREESPDDKVLEQLRSQVSSAPKVKGATAGRRFGISLGLLFVALLLTSVKSLIRMPETVLLSGFAVSLAGAAILTSGLFADTRKDVPSLLSALGFRRGLLIAASMVTLLVLALTAHHFGHFSHFLNTRAGLKCLSHAMLSGSLATALNFFAWRRSDPFAPSLTGALIGAFSGVIGVLSVGLSCVNHEGWHLLLGHGTVVVLLSLFGLFAGKKFLSP